MGSDVVLDMAAEIGLEIDKAAWSNAADLVEAAVSRMKSMHQQLVQLRIDGMLAKTDAKKAAGVIGLPGGGAPKKPGAENDEAAKSTDRLATAAKTLFGVLLAVRGAVGIKGMVKDVVDLGGHLNDTATQIGISTNSLQELTYAAKLSSVGEEDLVTSARHLSVSLQEVAKTGKGPAADALGKLGISFSQVKKLMQGEGGFDDVLGMIADKFQKMPPGMTKSALATDLFGRAGARLIPFLNQGADGIGALRDEAHELGVVIDKDAIGKLDDLGDDTDRLDMALGGLKKQIVVALIPVLHDMVTGMIEWLKANREVVQTAIRGVVDGLAIAFKTLALVVSGVVKVVQFFVEHSDLAIVVLIALGSALAVFGATAAAAFIVAQAPLLPWILLFTAIGAVIYDVWKSIKTGKGVTADVVRWISDKLDWLWGQLQAIGGAIAGFFRSIAEAAVAVWDTVVNFITGKIEAVRKKLAEIREGWLSFVEDNPELGMAISMITGNSAGTAGAIAANNITRASNESAPAGNVNVDAQIVVNPSSGMDEKALAQATADKLAGSIRHVQASQTGSGK